ncbi:S41 family peptidase [Pedobacter faecalis]|uniref:S41 family peptidase n=1 Tax=Pedobacter faecalis TaxID=3041495 RepID=UPI00254EA82C|nr:S41 family peptidase [Pedobacter sp. ELA7]
MNALRFPLIIVFVLAACGKSFSQMGNTPDIWYRVSEKSGFDIKISADKSKLLAITPGTVPGKARVQKFLLLPSKSEGLLQVDLMANSKLGQGDTCTFYVVVYRGGRPYLYYSRDFTLGSQWSERLQFSRYHRIPKEADSMVAGFALSGKVALPGVRLNVDLVQGVRFEQYRQSKNRFAGDKKNVERLAAVAKIWGLLKYFTPDHLPDNYDWDEALMSALADNFSSFDKDISVDDVIKKLLVPYKSFKAKNKEALPVNLQNRVEQLPISEKQKAKLRAILANSQKGKSKYFTAPSSEYPAPIFHDKNIDQNQIPDARSRILLLFRYWNIIEYFYPYKNQVTHDWEAVLTKLIGPFIEGDTENAYTKNLLLLNASIGDGHTAVPLNVLDMGQTLYSGLFTILPFTYRIDGNRLYINHIDASFKGLTGLEGGDELLSVNHIRVDSLVGEFRDYISHPSPAMKDIYLQDSRWMNLFPLMPDTLDIKYRRSGKIGEIKVPWPRTTIQSGLRYLLPDRQSGAPARKPVLSFIDKHKLLLIDPYTWNDALADSTSQLLEKSSALAIDLRTYPDWKFVNFCEALIRDSVPLIRFRVSTEIPGIFASSLKVSIKDGKAYEKDIYILISEKTRSRSEFLAKILKSGASNAILIGRRSAGADGDVASIPIIGRVPLSLRFSGVGAEYPNKVLTHQVGIVPDVVVDRQNLMGSDEIMNEVFKIVSP